MAGDENEAKHEASGLAETPTDKPLVEHGPDAPGVVEGQGIVEGQSVLGGRVVEEPAVSAEPGGGSSEWTASDARGPLNAAKPLPEGPASTVANTIAPKETTATARTEPAAAPPPRAKKASYFPVAAGLVLGAVIGAGSAYYVYTTTAPGSAADQKLDALATRVDALDKRPDASAQVAPLQAALAALGAKVSAAQATADAAKKAAQTAPAAGPDTSDLKAQLAALSAKVDALKQAPAAADQAAQDKANQDKAAQDKAVQDKAVQDKIAGLAAALASVQHDAASGADVKALQEKLAAINAPVADLQKQVAATQASIQTLRAGQTSLEGKITSAPALAVVSDSLISQINRGLPFTAQVNALESLGVDAAKIALLRQWSDQGVLSAKVLADKFEPLTDGLLTAPIKTAGTPSFIDRMKAGLGGLVAVHRVDDMGGDDVSSRIARIKADLAHDDVIAAVATWNTLPPETRAKGPDMAWGSLAKAHADALGIANGIESGAVASLGSKKS